MGRRKRVDNRQFSRMAFNAKVLVNHADSTFSGTVENLSLKGLFVKTDQKVPLDDAVWVVLSFAGSNGNLSLSLEGKVVRVNEDGIGVNFKKISIDSLEQTIGNNSNCVEGCQMGNNLCQSTA